MKAEDIRAITIEIETSKGKKFKVKNPKGIVLSCITETIKDLDNKDLKDKVGAIHFAGKEFDIMFCLHNLLTQMIKRIGAKKVLKVFNIVLLKKVENKLEEEKFRQKVYEMKNKNQLPN